MKRAVIVIAALAAALLAACAVTPAANNVGPVAGGELLVGNKSADTLWRLSLADGRKLGETPTAPGPHEIAVSPDGQLAVVSEYGRQAPGNTLGVYDGADGRLLRRIDLGTHTRPHGMRFDADGRRLGKICIPERVSNCTFGGVEENELFITATTSLYRVQLTTAGCQYTHLIDKNSRQ